ncbi:MAG: hypothetical protein RLZZ221_2861, partial [Verrucomicrobiota bacterium]
MSTTRRSSAAAALGFPAASRNLDTATDKMPGSAELSVGVKVARYCVAETDEKPLSRPPDTVMLSIPKSGEASLRVNVTTLVWPCSNDVRSAEISTDGAAKSVRKLPAELAAEDRPAALTRFTVRGPAPANTALSPALPEVFR